MQARPYQEISIAKTLQALMERRNTMLIAPTGAGKTFMLSKITDELLKRIGNKKRVLVLVHRNTINFQNQRAFENICGRKTSLFIANHKSLAGQVIFGMIQTLAGCYEKLPAFDVIVIDEFHHARAETYEAVINDQRKKNPDLYIFGVTATPNRGDEKGLIKIVDNFAHQISIRELIDLGYLVKPTVKTIDLFCEEEANLISDPKFFAAGATALINELQQNNRKKIVIFVSDRAHLEFLENALNNAGISTVSIHSEMDKKLINRSYNQFEKKDARVLINIDIATEGYDFPPIDCVVLERKLGNKSQLMQMVGRGLRPIDVRRYPGCFKSDCLVIDMGRNIERFGDLEQEVDLIGREKVPAMLSLPKEHQEQEFREKEIMGLMPQRESSFDLYRMGFAESFNFGDFYIKGLCGINQSIFTIGEENFHKNQGKINQIATEDLEKISKEILDENRTFFESLKGMPITKFQIGILINDFDIVGCSRYRASVLINFLLNKEKFLNHGKTIS